MNFKVSSNRMLSAKLPHSYSVHFSKAMNQVGVSESRPLTKDQVDRLLEQAPMDKYRGDYRAFAELAKKARGPAPAKPVQVGRPLDMNRMARQNAADGGYQAQLQTWKKWGEALDYLNGKIAAKQS